MATKYKKKYSPSFPGFSRAINLLFATKTKSNNDLHQGSFHINYSNIRDHHHTLTMSEIHEIL